MSNSGFNNLFPRFDFTNNIPHSLYLIWGGIEPYREYQFILSRRNEVMILLVLEKWMNYAGIAIPAASASTQ